MASPIFALYLCMDKEFLLRSEYLNLYMVKYILRCQKKPIVQSSMLEGKIMQFILHFFGLSSQLLHRKEYGFHNLISRTAS